LYSHSDYIEVLSTTGFVGFILYFSIYFMLWRRLSGRLAWSTDRDTVYNTGFSKAVLLCILVLALGIPHFLEVTSMSLLAVLVGQAAYFQRGRA
jgi:O-antigen ligase